MISVLILFKITVIILIGGLFWWIKKNKIPILCMACGEGGTYTRCIEGTGKGSPTCDIYNATTDAISSVKNSITSISDEFGKVKDAISVPYNSIKGIITQLETLFNNLNVSIPSIPDIKIPTIPNLSAVISFDLIPKFDPCLTVNTVVNNAVYPINQSVIGVETAINSIIGELNRVSGSLGFPRTNGVSIGKIPSINTSCNIDIGAEIKKIIPPDGKIDILAGVVTSINNNIINPFNSTLKIIKDGIQIAINAINSSIKTIIKFLKDTITSIIGTISKQLESINIFSGIIDKIMPIIPNIKSFNILNLIQIYVLPFIKKLLPFANINIMDGLFVCVVLSIIPFIIFTVGVIYLIISLLSGVVMLAVPSSVLSESNGSSSET